MANYGNSPISPFIPPIEDHRPPSRHSPAGGVVPGVVPSDAFHPFAPPAGTQPSGGPWPAPYQSPYQTPFMPAMTPRDTPAGWPTGTNMYGMGAPSAPDASYFPVPGPDTRRRDRPASANGGGHFSADWTGYPAAANPAAAPWASGGPATTPYGPAPAPQASPWAGAYAQFPPYTPGGPPPLVPGGYPGAPPYGATPYMGAAPFPGAAPAPMWGQSPGGWPAGYDPRMMGGMPPGGPTGAMPGPVRDRMPGGRPGFASLLAVADDAAKVDPFEEGPHYGPVLEPLLARATGAKIRLNPLLLPEPGDMEEDRPHLIWDMRYPSAKCRRSAGERNHASWMKGRKAPATFPRLTELSLVSRAFPWMITVRARDAALGVTCGDVIDDLDDFMHSRVREADHRAYPRAFQQVGAAQYRVNRSAAGPGGRMGEGMVKADYLGDEFMFGGVVRGEELMAQRANIPYPCMFQLVCRKAMRDAASEELRREWAREEDSEQAYEDELHGRAREAPSRSRSRHRSRRTSTTTAASTDTTSSTTSTATVVPGRTGSTLAP